MQWILIMVLTFADGSDEMHVAIAMEDEQICRWVEDNFIWAVQYKDVNVAAPDLQGGRVMLSLNTSPVQVSEVRCDSEKL